MSASFYSILEEMLHWLNVMEPDLPSLVFQERLCSYDASSASTLQNWNISPVYSGSSFISE
jgi:hypothetical protein